MVRLEYSGKKIRDLTVFETGMVPLDVDVKRREVVVVFDREEFEDRDQDEEAIVLALEAVIPRTVRVVLDSRD